MNSQFDIEILPEKLQHTYRTYPLTRIKKLGSKKSQRLFPYVINLHGSMGRVSCDEYCGLYLKHDYSITNTSHGSMNLYIQNLQDMETVCKQFDHGIRYIKGPINQFHIECLQNSKISISEKPGPYYGKYDCKLELFNWPFYWREERKTEESLEFLKENCDDLKVVSYLWGVSVYAKHEDFSKIQPFLALCVGDADFERSHRVTVRILNR